MPIKFRCENCNQLLAISRRKAGMAVQCPKCSRQVMVPVSDAAEKKAAAPAPAPTPPRTGGKGGRPQLAGPPIFERSDFDDLFRPAAAPPPAAEVFAFTEREDAPAPPPAAPPPPAPPVDAAFDVEPVLPPVAPEAPEPARGITLSARMATVLSVAAILALAGAFVAGLVVGYLIRPT